MFWLGELHFKNIMFISIQAGQAPRALASNKLKLDASFIKFFKLLKRCFKNIVFIIFHKVA
jgi:hypothetical protein